MALGHVLGFWIPFAAGFGLALLVAVLLLCAAAAHDCFWIGADEESIVIGWGRPGPPVRGRPHPHPLDNQPRNQPR